MKKGVYANEFTVTERLKIKYLRHIQRQGDLLSPNPSIYIYIYDCNLKLFFSFSKRNNVKS